MKIEVIEFFEKQKYPFKAMLERGLQHGLNEAQVHAGMEKVYERVHGGEQIKQIQLAREAFGEARKIDQEEFVQRIKTMMQASDRLERIEAELGELHKAVAGLALVTDRFSSLEATIEALTQTKPGFWKRLFGKGKDKAEVAQDV